MTQFYLPEHKVLLACMQMMRMHLETSASAIRATWVMEGRQL